MSAFGQLMEETLKYAPLLNMILLGILFYLSGRFKVIQGKLDMMSQQLLLINGRITRVEASQSEQRVTCQERLHHCEETREVLRDRMSALQGQIDRRDRRQQ